MAIGARSQSARTYLEKHLNEFLSCDLDELVKHGLRALRDTLPNEVDLSIKVNKLTSLTFHRPEMNYYHLISFSFIIFNFFNKLIKRKHT